jgi:FixJ family two-component response regulator
MKADQALLVAIVDDDASLCRSLARYLRASGMESRSYESAEMFLADTNLRFDCLLLDVQLGGMSGLELARQLKTQGSDVPFIFITAFDDAETKALALELGCAGYFRKSDPGAEVVKATRRATS